MNRQEYAIADRLPESLDRDNLRDVAQVIDEKLHELDALNELVCLYPRIDKLSSNLIDALAIQFHVDFYDTSLSLEKRRALVKNSIKWHMRKGTKGAVQELVQTVFESGAVSEWFEYGGEAYRFKIDILTAPEITQENLDLIVKVVNTVKNVRSWLDGIGFKRKSIGKIHIRAAPMVFKSYHVGPARVHDTAITGYHHTAVSPHIYKSYHVGPVVIQDTAIVGHTYTGGGVYIHKDYKI